MADKTLNDLFYATLGMGYPPLFCFIRYNFSSMTRIRPAMISRLPRS